MQWETILWDKLDCNPIVPQENSRRHGVESVFQESGEGRLCHSWVKPNKKARIREKSNKVVAQTDGYNCKPDWVVMSVFLSPSISRTGASIFRFTKPVLLLQETHIWMQGGWVMARTIDHPNYVDKQFPVQIPAWSPHGCTTLRESNSTFLSFNALIWKIGTITGPIV